MDKLVEVFNKMSVDDFKIGDYYWVHVTHINSPRDFYVRPTDYKYHMSLLERRGDKIRSADLVHDALVSYKSAKLNKLIRGQVLFVQAHCKKVHSCDFLAVDYGFTEFIVPKNQIFKLHKDSVYPPTVTNCQLANCFPLKGSTFDVEAIEAFKTYIGNERARMLVLSNYGSQLIVELVNTCPNDIGMLLALTNYTTMGKGTATCSEDTTVESGTWEEDEPEIENVKVKHATVVVGEVLHVCTQSGDSMRAFYPAKLHALKQFTEKCEEFTVYCNAQKPFSAEDAILGDFVGLKQQSSEKYERAIITKIKPDNVIAVKLIDWGNTVDAKFCELRLVKQDCYLDQPALAIYCTLIRAEMADEETNKCLSPGYEYFIKIKRVGNSFKTPHTVSIIHIHKKDM